MTIETKDRAEDQAAAQYSSIVDMLAAVECDYDRMQELRDECEEFILDRMDESGCNRACAEHEWTIERLDEALELAELEAAAGDCTDEEDARQRIQEDPLEVQVRSDWTNPGETLEAGEFMILLCTGGPAVRIVGELNRGEPCRAWLEYQDWGTPWTQWFGASSDTLCEYAANFFFGE